MTPSSDTRVDSIIFCISKRSSLTLLLLHDCLNAFENHRILKRHESRRGQLVQGRSRYATGILILLPVSLTMFGQLSHMLYVFGPPGNCLIKLGNSSIRGPKKLCKGANVMVVSRLIPSLVTAGLRRRSANSSKPSCDSQVSIIRK